jgi:hypothetical protein
MDAEADFGGIDVVLMLRGESRHCSDCATSTIFLPVEQHGWICTSCDAAVVLVDPAHAWASTAA